MKMRYLAAALIGAWYLKRRQRRQRSLGGWNSGTERQAGRNRDTPVVGPARNSPFYPTKDGVYKPEDIPHTTPAGGEASEIPAL